MSAIKGLFNAVADPRLFFMLAVGLLALVVWQREKVASNAFGPAYFIGARSTPPLRCPGSVLSSR